MDEPREHSGGEIKRLQRCINDLVSVLALPAMWSGGESSRVVHTVLDAILGMLRLDFVYARVKDPDGQGPIEMVKASPSRELMPDTQEIRGALKHELKLRFEDESFGNDSQHWPQHGRVCIGGRDISIVSMRLGLDAGTGVIVAGSERADFPEQTESLVLSVAANQAAIGLQEARLRREQKDVASELDRRVAQRTAELAGLNEELKKEVAERRRAEEALRVRELNARLIVDSIPGLVCTMNPAGEIELFNRRILDFFGKAPEELRHWGSGDTVHPDDRPGVMAALRHALETGTPYDVEHRCRRADGVYRWFQVRALPVRATDGSVTGWYALLIDIDDRKRAEGALRSAERDLISIVNTIPTTAWSTRPDGYCEFLNQRWLDYAGFSAEQAQGWGWRAVIHPDDVDALWAYWQSCLATGTPLDTEARMRRFDGTYRWFLFRANPMRDESGNIIKWFGTNVDIEDRKRADEALQSSERNLHQIVNTIPALAWSARPDGSTEFFNQHYLDYVGLSAEQAGEWGWTAAVHPDDLNGLIAAWQRMMAADEAGECEARLRRFDGEYRWFLFRTNPLRDELGRIVRWYGTNTDIDDRKRAEEELRRTEARKTAILDSALDCIMTIDHEGRITEFNPAAERTFGYRRDEAVGKQLADLIIPAALRGAHRQGLARYLATGEERVLGQRLELPAVRADGTEFPVELAISRIRLDGPPSFTGYLRDITERKQAEEELRRSEQFLAQGQHLARLGSFSWRLENDHIMWSEQLYRIFEFEPGGPVTFERIRSRIHPEDMHLLEDMIERARGGASDLEYEDRLLMPDRSVKYLHLVAHGTRDLHGGLEYIGTVQDVTERWLSEEALSQARSDLARVSRVTSLGMLTAAIAHEINQPLSGIITNASTCLRMLAAEPPNVEGARETAKRTIRDGNRASELIARLRALFTKKGSTNESVDLNEAAREVIALSLSELQRNRVILRPEFEEDLPLVTGDRVQLQQVILNLLKNASDAMSAVDDRPRQLRIRTERETDDQVRLTVQDAGVGIDPQGMDRLFQAFYTTKNDGMGIGLSVSRSIIERHQGRLWAAQNDGPGATFSFSIPSGAKELDAG